MIIIYIIIVIIIGFLWRKRLMASVEVLENMGNDRIAVISVKQRKSEQMFLVATYLPCATESTEVYNSYVEQLENVLYQLQQKGTTIVMGDINAHVGYLGGPSHSVNSQLDCSGPIETYYSNNGCSKTTIDHIFIAKDKYHTILQAAVLSDCSSNLSYHLPIRCVIKAEFLAKPMNNAHKILLWNKLEDKNYQEKYENKVATIFQSTYYRDLNITSAEILENIVEDVVLKLSEAALAVVPSRKPKPYLKSYWNASLKNLTKNVKKFRRAWIADGRPRGVENESFVSYKQAKKEFRVKHKEERSMKKRLNRSKGWKSNMMQIEVCL